jgi:hypothetical protein
VAAEFQLAEGWIERELAVEANAGGNVAEELLDGRDADCREHFVAVAICQ